MTHKKKSYNFQFLGSGRDFIPPRDSCIIVSDVKMTSPAFGDGNTFYLNSRRATHLKYALHVLARY